MLCIDTLAKKSLAKFLFWKNWLKNSLVKKFEFFHVEKKLLLKSFVMKSVVKKSVVKISIVRLLVVRISVVRKSHDMRSCALVRFTFLFVCYLIE